jgi:predicted nucleotidyltransferase
LARDVRDVYLPGVPDRRLPDLVTTSIARFRATLEARFGARLRELVLFGSQARGDAHEDSDVDLLVVVDDLTTSERSAVLDMAYDAGVNDDDLVVLNPLPYSTAHVADMRAREKGLMREIARDGVPA